MGNRVREFNVWSLCLSPLGTQRLRDLGQIASVLWASMLLTYYGLIQSADSWACMLNTLFPIWWCILGSRGAFQSWHLTGGRSLGLGLCMVYLVPNSITFCILVSHDARNIHHTLLPWQPSWWTATLWNHEPWWVIQPLNCFRPVLWSWCHIGVTHTTVMPTSLGGWEH